MHETVRSFQECGSRVQNVTHWPLWHVHTYTGDESGGNRMQAPNKLGCVFHSNIACLGNFLGTFELKIQLRSLFKAILNVALKITKLQVGTTKHPVKWTDFASQGLKKKHCVSCRPASFTPTHPPGTETTLPIPTSQKRTLINQKDKNWVERERNNYQEY